MHRPGRPRVPRKVSEGAVCRCYAPQCCPHQNSESVPVLPEEIEILRLIDLQGLEQEQAAAVLGVSRKTLWRDLHEIRRKIADALVNGKGMEISGCIRRDENLCPKRNRMFCPLRAGTTCPRFQEDASQEKESSPSG